MKSETGYKEKTDIGTNRTRRKRMKKEKGVYGCDYTYGMAV